MTRIMIVEDEVITALYVKTELSKYGFNIIKTVNTGEKAITTARQENPDIILMDISLATKMDGLEAARQILSFSRPFIIFMTGYQDEKLRKEAEDIEALYFIKPLDIQNIAEAISGKSIN